MKTINFIGFLVILLALFGLYNASETGPFIFKNNQIKKIKILRDSFEPNDITINLGDEIIWQNHDYVLRHTVVNDDPLLRNSDVLLKGDEFKIIFDRPGDYIFYSSLYPEFEKGIIRVRPVKSGNEFRKNMKENVLTVVLKLYGTFLKLIKSLYQRIKDKFYSFMTLPVIIGFSIISIILILILLARIKKNADTKIEISIN